MKPRIKYFKINFFLKKKATKSMKTVTKRISRQKDDKYSAPGQRELIFTK